jgi:kumamolisin
MARAVELPVLLSLAAALLLTGALVRLQGAVPATDATQVSLPGSIREVEAAPATGKINLHRPFISRRTLKVEESAATLEFEVALKMRDFSGLQQRISRGERIPFSEMAAHYDPSAGDYQKVVDWLTGNGFTITRRDGNHLAIFARGKVSQIQKALGVNFARVTFEGKDYTSAVTAPKVPASISSLLVGINGLQPHVQLHKNLVLKPNSLTNPYPPYLPSQLAQAYQASGLYSSSINGSGQTIAIVIDTFPSASDLQSFWSTYSVSQSISNVSFIQVVPGSLPSPSGEETLDTEWSSSIAPGANVRVYASRTLDFSTIDQCYQQVYSDVTTNPGLEIHQMSMSFGAPENEVAISQLQTDDQYFANLTAAGVTVFASSGDQGVFPTGASTITPETPSSDPNITGVGGTSLSVDASGNPTTEVVWNNGAGASGGGISQYFGRPSWQAGTGVPAGPSRLVPDVASVADPNTGAVVILDGSQMVYGGTSWSSPTWAGFCALINQDRANASLPSIGLLGPYLYPQIGSANFRDITSGNNGYSGVAGYSAGIGYDLTTGIGVPNVQTLAQTLLTFTPAPTTQIAPLSQDVAPGQNATFTVATSGTPISYQWQRMPLGLNTWSNLTDNSIYSGTATASLTINGATTAMSGDQFQCVLTFSGNSAETTASCALAVETPLSVKTLAGTVGVTGLVNATGTSAEFNYPSGAALDSSGNLYVADFTNNVIREVNAAGVVSTAYGSVNGSAGSTDNPPLFNLPNAIAADGSNNLYVADTGNNTIREISSGQVTTIAGQPGVAAGFANGAATTQALFSNPNGVAVDGSGNVYVADTGNDVIREISLGQVTTLAGQPGVAGYADGAGATQALFNYPTSVAVDGSGNVYVADYNNDVVRKITPAGVVSTLAGQAGIAGYIDGPGTKALFNAPNGVTVDSANNVYVTDATFSDVGNNNLLRRISPLGVVSTLAGQPNYSGSADGTGSAAQFFCPQATAINGQGEFFVADTFNQTIRVAGIEPAIATQPVSQVVTVGQPATFSVIASGSGPFTYQWQKNASNINGATGSSYTIASVAATDAGNYSVAATNTFGQATSGTATLIPAASQPVAQNAAVGQSITFSISVTGSGGPFTYQWLKNGIIISGATNSSYTIGSVASTDAGNYSVMVNDTYGVATTLPFGLTVSAASSVSDTPTLPTWALLVLGLLLLATGSRIVPGAPSIAPLTRFGSARCGSFARLPRKAR